MTDTFSPTYLIGIDGGGTCCRARLQDTKGRTLGESTSGPANIRLGLDVAWANIMTSIDGALGAAALNRDILAKTALGLGLAGVVTPDDCTRTARACPVAFGRICAAADYHVACFGAFGGADGAIQIAGTGSSGYAIVGGEGQPVGGWGFLLSEKGSAAAIGRDAIRAALEAHDGLAIRTPLTEAIIVRFGTPAAIIDWSETARPSDYGALSPLVFEFADEGDAVAQGLVRQVAADLDRFIAHLTGLGAPKVCLTGGLAPHILPWLSESTIDRLAQPQMDILDGAILMAHQGDAASIALRSGAPV
ncbi:MAG: BadF/BadG/BcrA/BcrD ATPase family protein [Asticcacaulis sp.]|uniref:BadF/BadG/BcrA/BcrD ATPase family protein n=1 Tax=Asticcacaulis sp. TaxID=1872648 RepID=UPI0039E316E5